MWSWIENELIELINSNQFRLSIPIQFQFKIFQFNSNSIHAELNWIDYQFQFNSWIDPSPASIQAQTCPNVNLEINNMIYNWHILIAPIEEDLIIGLDFLLHFKIDILFSDGVISIGNSYQNLDSFQIDHSRVNTFEVNNITVNQNIDVKPWSGKFIKLPINCKFGNWKIFESKYFDDVFIPNTIFNVKDDCFTILILNLRENKFKLKYGSILGIITDVHDPELYEESPRVDVTVTRGASSSRDIGVQVNFEDIKINKIVISPLEELSKIIEKISINSENCFPASESPDFNSIEDLMPEHLQDLFKRSCTQLTFFQCLEVAYLLVEFAHVFSKNEFDLGLFKLIKHRIKLFDYTSQKYKLRPTPFHFRDEEERYIQNMLDAGIIQSSCSDWASPVCLVRKRCGGVRVCTDYRGLNRACVKDAFPLPRIHDCLDTLSGNEWFSNIDMASGYYQVEVENEDRYLTAFITKYGLFEYVRMPFGLSNGPATFQRVVHLVLAGLLWRKALAYLDDVTILGKNFKNALENLREVLDRFADHNLKLKPKKCHLFQKSIEFLGRIVDKNGVAIKPAHIKIASEWPVPAKKKDLESFLGFANYHRDHIPQFAHFSEPLYRFITKSKSGKITLSDELLELVESIKTLIVNAPVLTYPSEDHTFILDTDASDTAIGGELLQLIDGVEHVISYGSYILTSEQRKYCTTRKELLAVLRFCRQFRYYLLGRKFVVRTDHNSLVWLLGFKNIEGQLSRWIQELSQYDMIVVHRPGKDHVNADALSRIPDSVDYCVNYTNNIDINQLPCFPCKFCARAHEQWSRFFDDVDYVVPLSIRKIKLSTDILYREENWGLKYSAEDLRQFQDNDPDLSVIINWLETANLPTESELALSSPCVKHLWLHRDQLSFHKDVLYYRWEDALEPKRLFLVPSSLKSEIIENFHDHSYAGHMGRDNTRRNIQKSFYWHGLYSDVAAYVATCSACSKNKKANKLKKAGLLRYHAGSAMERVHLDILGPFNVSSRGSKYVLGMIDQFTKWLECVPLPDQSAEKIATAAIDEFFCRFGMPLTIHTDQGSNFVGNVFQAVCNLLEIRKTQTTPQSNGQVERYNRTIVEMIRCLKLKSEKDWDVYLPHITSAIRCLENPSTGFTANRLMLGREVHKPIHVKFGIVPDGFENVGEYVRKLDEIMRETHRVARDNLKGALRTRKKDYDVKLKTESYQVGDFVYKINSSIKKGVSKKLLPIYDGPFIVTCVLSPILIEIENRKRRKVVHHDKLKHCNDRCIPLWIRRRRQELLSLDDTLPYDEEEHSFLSDSCLDKLFDDGDVIIDHHTNTPSDDVTDETNDISPSPIDVLPAPTHQSTQITRRGRQIRKSKWLSDYVTD